MVFHAYLDPAAIVRASECQPYGYQCLIAILRGFIQNCCVIDPNGEVSAALADRVRQLPANSDRKTLKELLGFLNVHYRFIDDANHADVIVTESLPHGLETGAATEVCSLASYQFTDFEGRRSLSAHGGVTLGFREISPEQLFERHFHRALRHAQQVQICDGSFGENFNQNYRYTVERFLTWLRTANVLGSRCKVSFQCLAAFREEDRSNRALRRRDWRPDEKKCAQVRSFLDNLGVSAELYRFLPHDRFLLTDQFALEIGRGMDFLDQRNECIRDVSLATKDLRQVKRLLGRYAQHQLPQR
jgi:hypothetical protein